MTPDKSPRCCAALDTPRTPMIPLERGGGSNGWSARRTADPMPSAPISRSPSVVSPDSVQIATRSPSAANSVTLLPKVIASKPTDSSNAPWSAGRNATTIGPPSTSAGGTSARFTTVPSMRRSSPLVGVKPRARTTSATRSRRSAAMAFGETPSPKPSSCGVGVRSNRRTFQPACRRAIAAASPPIPAPTIRAVRFIASEHRSLESYHGNAATPAPWARRPPVRGRIWPRGPIPMSLTCSIGRFPGEAAIRDRPRPMGLLRQPRVRLRRRRPRRRYRALRFRHGGSRRSGSTSISSR